MLNEFHLLIATVNQQPNHTILSTIHKNSLEKFLKKKLTTSPAFYEEHAMDQDHSQQTSVATSTPFKFIHVFDHLCKTPTHCGSVNFFGLEPEVDECAFEIPQE